MFVQVLSWYGDAEAETDRQTQADRPTDRQREVRNTHKGQDEAAAFHKLVVP